MSPTLSRIRHRLLANSNRLQDGGGSPLDPIERRSQRVAFPTVQVNVITAGRRNFQADSLSDDERHRFCLELSRVPRPRSIAPTVEQLVRVLVGEHSELGRSG